MQNCEQPPKCSKCAERHFITACQHTGPPECANYRKEHRSFSRQCPVYEAKLSQYLARPNAKPPYQSATPSLHPAWTATQAQLTQTESPPLPQKPAEYNANFPLAPGKRRVSQTAPVAVTSSSSMGRFHALHGKWNEINSLININNILQALDVY